MSDKERILMIIITRIIPRLIYGCHSYEDKEEESVVEWVEDALNERSIIEVKYGYVFQPL